MRGKCTHRRLIHRVLDRVLEVGCCRTSRTLYASFCQRDPLLTNGNSQTTNTATILAVYEPGNAQIHTDVPDGHLKTLQSNARGTTCASNLSAQPLRISGDVHYADYMPNDVGILLQSPGLTQECNRGLQGYKAAPTVLFRDPHQIVPFVEVEAHMSLDLGHLTGKAMLLQAPVWISRCERAWIFLGFSSRGGGHGSF
eukprot:2338441-Amphidinium_carterae.1